MNRFASLCWQPLRVGAFCTLVALPTFAMAADPAPVSGPKEWSLYGTVGVGYAPRYGGSNESTVGPVLGAGILSPYGFFLSTAQGLGWQTSVDGGSNLRLYVSPSASRADRKKRFGGSDFLRGMGEIEMRPQIGIDVEAPLGPVTLTGSVVHAFKKGSDRDVGSAYTLMNLGVNTTVYQGSAGSIGLTLSGTLGDSNYMRTWYGVSSRQASRTGFRQYSPNGGLESVALGANWVLPLDKNWSLSVAGEARQLLGDAGDSPIVQRRSQFSIGSMVTYSY